LTAIPTTWKLMSVVCLRADVRHGSLKRCASAVGEGANGVTFVHRYVSNG
jgi:hypothetical protein